MPPPRSVLTKTTYLEMLAPPAAAAPGVPPAAAVRRLAQPSVEEYLALYNGVGRDYHWVDRNFMPREALQAILADPGVEVYVLEVDGRPGGYAELDRRVPGEIELAYFGLFGEFIGRGLGTYLLAWAVRRAWSYGPKRVWVHTCDLDHPAALPTYLKAGFTIYDERVIQQALGEQ